MKRSFVYLLMFSFVIFTWSCANETDATSTGKQLNDDDAQSQSTTTAQPKTKDVKDNTGNTIQDSENSNTNSKVNQPASKQQPTQTSPDNSEIVIGNEVGNDLGEFVSYDPDSNIVKLSDYRGKLTMVVLWNSLCAHCVTENQKHAETYNEYHDKQFVNGDGFEIYAIALDKDRATWIEHLQNMNYPWKGNVYVIDSWKDPDIRFFGIKNLPGAFLLDENGIIIAKKFTATEVEKLLEDNLMKEIEIFGVGYLLITK